MKMFRSIGATSKIDFWFDWIVVDSLMCIYFFQYLNLSRQGNGRHKEVAMYNMIHVTRTLPDILHRDTAFSLLGYSFMHENQLINAYSCFNQSLIIRPYHNAAKFFLRLLFNRIHATDRGHTPYRKGRIDCGSYSSIVQHNNEYIYINRILNMVNHVIFLGVIKDTSVLW
ncbi:hypothetical protein CHS0354_021373 [Potamilus streckersoni]|uniref:Uncharacterized protein n=1 Tax=Potamilus streckersoni TaxID=2493646 RepID=A0AAE0VPX6_9BIVA|nr:hypothetical protein CHS0354_021373 [Potamilus streckersoni]